MAQILSLDLMLMAVILFLHALDVMLSGGPQMPVPDGTTPDGTSPGPSRKTLGLMIEVSMDLR
jgi:hypothetical protein